MQPGPRWILYFPMGLRNREGIGRISGGEDMHALLLGFALLDGLAENLAEGFFFNLFQENGPARFSAQPAHIPQAHGPQYFQKLPVPGGD
jgi:hypothetical protein